MVTKQNNKSEIEIEKIKKEFNLSEKIFGEDNDLLWKKDVKESIRLLKAEIPNEVRNGKQNFHKKIDKIVGDKLC